MPQKVVKCVDRRIRKFVFVESQIVSYIYIYTIYIYLFHFPRIVRDKIIVLKTTFAAIVLSKC